MSLENPCMYHCNCDFWNKVVDNNSIWQTSKPSPFHSVWRPLSYIRVWLALITFWPQHQNFTVTMFTKVNKKMWRSFKLIRSSLCVRVWDRVWVRVSCARKRGREREECTCGPCITWPILMCGLAVVLSTGWPWVQICHKSESDSGHPRHFPDFDLPHPNQSSSRWSDLKSNDAKKLK